MPNLKVLNMAGAEVGTIELSDEVFGAEVNGAVLHSAVRAYLMNQRQGTQSTLTRTEVSGGAAAVFSCGAAATRSPGDRMGPAEQDRALPVLLSGLTAVWRLVLSPEPTVFR